MAKKVEKDDRGILSRWLGIGDYSKRHPSGNPPVPQNDLSLVLETSQVSVDYKSQLGVGSFGRVYKGSYMGKPCAVKVFNAGAVKGEIAREAEVTSLIQHHKNIVQVYGLWYGESEDGYAFPDGQPALVMELCSTNLKSYLDGKKKNPHDRYTLKDKLTILYQVTLAMIYLHSKHIVHGDLSAANILLQISGQQPSLVVTAKVGDFGQARVLNPETLKHLTKDHGKEDIMPPEVLKGDIITLTIAVDVFSFGCLVPYVATCVYPKPVPIGLEFDRRKTCLRDVSETGRRIFEPLMEKCLADRPHLRGTFEDVLSVLGPQMNKWVKGTYSETEEERKREIEKLKSNLLEYDRKVQSLQEEKEAIEVSYHELEEEKKSLETTNKLLNVDLEDRISKVEQLEETLRQRDATIKDANERSALLEVQCENLRTELKEMEGKLEHLKSKMEQKEDAIFNMKEHYDKQYTDSRSQLEKLGRDHQSLKSRFETEQDERQAAQMKVNKLEGQLLDLNKQLRKKAEKEQELQGQISGMHSTVTSVESVLDKFQTLQVNKASVDLRLDQTVLELKAEKESHSKVIKNLEVRSAELENIKDFNKQLQENSRHLEEKVSEYQKSQADMTTRLYNATAGNKAKDQELALLLEEQRRVVKEKSVLEAKLTHVQKELDNSKRLEEEMKVQLEMCRKKKEAAEDELAASNKSKNELTMSLRASSNAVRSSEDKRLKLQNQIDSLTSEVGNLKKVEGGLERDLVDSHKAEKTAKDQLAKNQKDLRSAQNTISQYKVDFKGVKGQLEEKGRKVKELEQSVQSYERRLKTEGQKTTDAQKEVDTLKAQLRNKEKEANSLGERLTDAKIRADTAERQWRQLKGQLKTANTGIADLQKSERNLKSELESVKGERDGYLQEKERLSSKNTELDKEVRLANQQLSITKEVSTRTTRELNDLRANYEIAQESNELLKKYETEIDRLKQELQQSKAGHSKVVTGWENEKKNVSRLEKEVEHLKTELQQREESQSQLREDKDKMRRDNYELRESLERHLHLIEQKDRTIKALQDKCVRHVQSLQAMEEKQRELIIRLNKQTKHFKQKETEWRAEIERITTTFKPALNILETEHEELQRKVVSRKEVIRQKEQEINELKRSKDTLSVEVQEKERELAELKKKLEAEIARREENQQRMKEYKATSEKMERLAGTLQSELCELTQLLTEQEASATAKQEELKGMLEVAKKERMTFAEQKEQEERIQEELKKQLDKQREQWESEESKANRLTERIHSLEIDLKKECVHSIKLQAQLDSVNRKVSSMKLEMSCLEEENTQLKLARKLFDLEKANFEAYRSTSMMTEESTATVLTQLEEDNKMLSERCDSYKVERDRTCEEKENLLAKLDQLKKKIETLEDQMRQLIAEKVSLKDESDRWRNDSSELKIECDRSKSELLRLNQERQSLLTQRQELERERDKWMKECKAMKELSSQRMVSSSSEEPVDLEDFERQEDRKRKVGQMQTDIDRLKELAGSMAGGSDSVDPNMSSTDSDN